MAICERCGGFTKRKGVCRMCRGVYKIANQFGTSLEEDKSGWFINRNKKK